MGLAGILGVTPGLISQWKQGVRPIKVERCVEIERVTNRQVMRWDLRPNDWWQIWPELIDHPDAPPIPKSVVSAIPDGLIPGPQGLGSFSSEVQRG
ncbi:YdaS family helix-turn-helix protein [uncultured Limnobacter sp.]|uniref:transcriptional regulator n=1 Tax=uncultured Limnobacter sp. TaxID=199681 RepID=UPI0030F9E9C1